MSITVYFVTSREDIRDAVHKTPVRTLSQAEGEAKSSANICGKEFVVVSGTIRVDGEIKSFFPEKKP